MTQLEIIANALTDVKANDITIFKMEGISSLLDYVIIATAGSQRQGDAIVKHIKDDLALAGFDYPNIEGKSSGWILIDAKDIVVHVFTAEDRELYGLDILWNKIPKVNVEDLI